MNSRWFRATGVAASVLALFFLLGGHWFTLQSVAWTRMFVGFARTDTLVAALDKTFDGEHPCRMCLGIREARQQEERQQNKLQLLKREKLPELLCEQRYRILPFAPADAGTAIAFVPRLHSDFLDSPPSPPPRQSNAVS
jgi:hypothetical protein